MKAIEISIENYTKALNKLIEGINQANDELDRDGVLQRFEFTFELFWKTLKLILKYEGFECRSPRSCIKEAFEKDYIVDSETFLDMLEDRNLSSHVYDEKISLEIYERIKNIYLVKFVDSSKSLQDYVRNL